MTKTYRWIVDGERAMHCGGCARSVEFALSRLQSVQGVKADFKSQQIEVQADESLDVSQIIHELRELDYEVREVV